MRDDKIFRDREAREKARIVLEEIIELHNISDPFSMVKRLKTKS
jgi:hypothetical protein